MKKHLFVLGGLLLLFSSIVFLLFRVSYLENRQKAFASLPQNVLQTSQGNLEKVNDKDYIQGNLHAAVTLIEYSDFECPSCQRMHPIYQKIISQFGKDIRFVQRMFPLPQNKNAEKEAEAVLCAGKIGGQKAYWEYGDGIFTQTKGTENGEGFSLNGLVPLAKKIGLNEKEFTVCLQQEEMAKAVGDQKSSGELAGVSQLPTLFIIDKQGKSTLVTGEQSLATLQVILSYIINE